MNHTTDAIQSPFIGAHRRMAIEQLLRENVQRIAHERAARRMQIIEDARERARHGRALGVMPGPRSFRDLLGLLAKHPNLFILGVTKPVEQRQRESFNRMMDEAVERMLPIEPRPPRGGPILFVAKPRSEHAGDGVAFYRPGIGPDWSKSPFAKAKDEPAKPAEPKKPVALGRWIPWNGGESPVPKGTKGLLRLRNGDEWQTPQSLDDCSWGHNDKPELGGNRTLTIFEIVAFKVTELGQPSMATTDWFPGTVAPAHSGVYALRNTGERLMFAYFNAETGRWFAGGFTVESAQDNAKNRLLSMWNDPAERTTLAWQWRGFKQMQEIPA